MGGLVKPWGFVRELQGVHELMKSKRAHFIHYGNSKVLYIKGFKVVIK